jgi:hypothetical protein
MAKKKPVIKQKFKPGVRVEDEAWDIAIELKSLNGLCGRRVYIGDLFSKLMITHGPAIRKKLAKEYEKLKKDAEQ